MRRDQVPTVSARVVEALWAFAPGARFTESAVVPDEPRRQAVRATLSRAARAGMLVPVARTYQPNGRLTTVFEMVDPDFPLRAYGAVVEGITRARTCGAGRDRQAWSALPVEGATLRVSLPTEEWRRLNAPSPDPALAARLAALTERVLVIALELEALAKETSK